MRVLATAIGVTAAMLVILELVLRLFGVRPHGGVLVSDDNCYFGWEANVHEVHRKGPLQHLLLTDALGFRVSGSGQIAPAPGCKVLALGDSFTEGLYVSAEEAWPAVLETMLQKRGYRVQVLNGGMRGQSILQERIAALGRWQALRPEVVVVEHTSNDIMDLSSAEASGCRAGSAIPVDFHPTAPPVVRSLSLFRLAQDLGIKLSVQHGAAAAAGKTVQPVSLAECDRLAADYRREVRALAQGVDSNGGHLLFAQWTYFSCDSSAHPDFQAHVTQLRADLDATRAAFLDATDVLEAAGTTLQPHDNHPSPAGHRAFAGRVADALDSRGWLATCREQ